MTLEFLYQNRLTFITHPHTNRDKAKTGLERSINRFQLCIQQLDKDIAPALHALFAEHLFDKSIQEAVTDLVKEAIQGFRDDIEIETNDETIRAKIYEKIDSIRLSVMFPDDVLDIPRINKLYDEFEFLENQTLLELSADIWKFGSKNRKEIKDHWIHHLDKILRNVLDTLDIERNHFSKIINGTLIHKTFKIFLFLRCSCCSHTLSIISSKTTEVFQHGDTLFTSSWHSHE